MKNYVASPIILTFVDFSREANSAYGLVGGYLGLDPDKGTQFFFFTGWHIALPTYLSEKKCSVFFSQRVEKKTKPKS